MGLLAPVEMDLVNGSFAGCAGTLEGLTVTGVGVVFGTPFCEGCDGRIWGGRRAVLDALAGLTGSSTSIGCGTIVVGRTVSTFVFFTGGVSSACLGMSLDGCMFLKWL